VFPLADNDFDRLQSEHPDWNERRIEDHMMKLCGGDFKGFEVTIALRVFDEPALTAKVKSGIKVHGIMGQYLFPGKTYEEIRASEGQDPDMYDKGKKGFFLKIYFGNEHTIHNKLGIPLDIATDADRKFNRDYPRVKAFQDRIIKDFSALQQIGGIGSKIEWRQPKDYSETFLGWRRYFTLENRVIRTLYELAQDPPLSIRSAKIKVQRRDRIQTAGGAAQSALYAAAFAMSSRNVRAAGNNEIQSPGGEITKALQVNLWKLQPVGAHPWVVQPLNVHDEIMCPTKAGYEEQVEAKAKETVEEYRKHVPLLDIDWFTNIPDWSNKKGESRTDKAGSLQLSV
jgi:DNA polymerase I-like protein with 3'-5' exonuclease and polymerase domains